LELLRETVPDAHVWWRIADPGWADPREPSVAKRSGGRWNPPDSFPVLYLNEDVATAQRNLRAFIARWPYEPEDLRDDRGPMLVGCVLPRRQVVGDARRSRSARPTKLTRGQPWRTPKRPAHRHHAAAVARRFVFDHGGHGRGCGVMLHHPAPCGGRAE